jgi:hypothetical protein
MTDPYLPEEDSAPDEPTPWGFRIVLVLGAIYLLYRFGQLFWCGLLWLRTGSWC